MSGRATLVLGAAAMFVAVALGAFGAHALKGHLTAELTGTWQTAVQYHAWHALGLLAVGILMLQWPERALLGVAAWLFAAGIVLFSGSLYVLALTGVRAFGAVTPFGGIAFLVGWVMVAAACFRRA